MPICKRCSASIGPAARFCPACGAAVERPTASTALTRKTVTLVFCDLVGSTAIADRLDAEVVRDLMTRYFAEMSTAIARHGGTVEKFVGDAVMAVFGIPTAREDDALRAVRAATEMRDAVMELSLDVEAELGTPVRVRIGVNTGEVVAGDPSQEQAFASGDAVNVTARLEQVAPPGEVLISERTEALVRAAARTEQVEPVDLKGKPAPIRAFRLLGVRPHVAGAGRRLDAPLVGRERELAALELAFESAMRRNRPEAMLVLGEAGLGKSRLARELTGHLAGDVHVVSGSCPPYGEGALYPVEQAIRVLAGINTDEDPGSAEGKLRAIVGDAEPAVYARLMATLRIGSEAIEMQESFWAIRRLIEAISDAGPVLFVLDDLHWADQRLLALVEYLIGTAQCSALFVLLARPELAEREAHPVIAAVGKRIRLAPLGFGASQAIVSRMLSDERLPSDVFERIEERAAGNPLFLEELVSALIERGHLRREGGSWQVGEISELPLPDTVEALLQARMEALSAPERETLEAAAIAGDPIWTRAIAPLLPTHDATALATDIAVLGEKGFLVPVSSSLAGEEQLRFAHILMQETAYRGISKRRRASAHLRLADWLEDRTADSSGRLDDSIARHLETAHRLRSEFGATDEELLDLATRAVFYLLRTGERALDREDYGHAVGVLRRAETLASGDVPQRASVLDTLAQAFLRLGRYAEAEGAAGAAADAAGDNEPGVRWIARLDLAQARAGIDPRCTEQYLREAEAAVSALDGTIHDRALAEAWIAKQDVLVARSKVAAAVEASRHAIGYAEATGNERLVAQARQLGNVALVIGPSHVDRVAEFAKESLARVAGGAGSSYLEGGALRDLGWAYGAQGLLDEAQLLLERSRTLLEERGIRSLVPTVEIARGEVEVWAGRIEAAERCLRSGYGICEEIGEGKNSATLVAQLADVLARQGRMAEATGLLKDDRHAVDEDDMDARVRRLGASARILVGHEPDRAATCAAEAIGIVEETDLTPLRADAWLVQAEVSFARGRQADAARAAGRAEALFREKGILLAATTAAGLQDRIAN